MSKLLYIESSPRKKRSSSIEVAQRFLEAYTQAHPSNSIITLDLWQKELPPFDSDVIDSKYAIMHGQAHTEAQRKSWRAVEQLIHDFKEADRYVISLPMWNFGIPYKLKHYIDLLVQPTYTFSHSPEEGYKGLVTGKPIVLIYSRGGAYGPGSGGETMDLQKSYMEEVLKFIGFTDIRSIIIEPTLASPEDKDKTIAKAKQEAIKMAAEF
ncbi:MAG: NAD(P)H-dependent oxidoreductase [Parachlamydia sp.]|jgi:FMN-dependent NADH-azoreductase|nr:NAD(P)H-dependent oxidoreductase [Parachlamydia sp.]